MGKHFNVSSFLTVLKRLHNFEINQISRKSLGSTSSIKYENMGIETPAFILGALTAGGGTFGYVKTGSIPSVAAGVTVGALYLLGGYRIQSRQSYGVELALLASIVLAGSSIPRALRSQKPLPTGLSLLALYGLYTYGSAYRAKLRRMKDKGWQMM